MKRALITFGITIFLLLVGFHYYTQASSNSFVPVNEMNPSTERYDESDEWSHRRFHHHCRNMNHMPHHKMYHHSWRR